MIEAGEQRLIEHFVTHPAVKTLNKRVLGWLSWDPIMPFDFGGPTLFEHGIRGQLSSIVDGYFARQHYMVGFEYFISPKWATAANLPATSHAGKTKTSMTANVNIVVVARWQI